MQGRISSFESMGTLDGPGIRCVVFMQGCRLRCVYCHNPETWDLSGGTLYSADDVMARIRRSVPYFGGRGGVTVSGGEPLVQAAFVSELFEKCREEKIHTALDTAGTVMNPAVLRLLALTDLILLDIKMLSRGEYLEYTGGSFDTVLDFLKAAGENNNEVWLRHVVVPGITDKEKDIIKLVHLAEQNSCVKKIELLPFKKLCLHKYRAAGIDFPLENTPEAPDNLMEQLNSLLPELLRL